MPDPHDLYQPTATMPVVEQRGVYRAADHRRVALLAAAGSAVVLSALVVWLFSGDDESPAPVAAPPVVVVTSAAPTEEPSPSEEAPSEEATATTPAVTVRPARPAELIAALRAVVDSLEDQGQIDDDGAEALDRRLKSAADRLERGKAKDAARKMDEFAEKLVDLREDDDISQSAFNALASGATQVRAALPAR
ncbi:hypothetical protein KZ829_00860 [Actinoplanes hulinensis]|uniref:FIMAH domain-containing protein n=1 Tax=Actinoplanes hulinensis TaxID=1144547 RepID=A0ABS7AU23_9ACTN|nr:hypothetical protein [Actinoplanes hulinensis]MBW6432298.1 hypothetical protein [Actinoplanes hulinensis]